MHKTIWKAFWVGVTLGCHPAIQGSFMVSRAGLMGYSFSSPLYLLYILTLLLRAKCFTMSNVDVTPYQVDLAWLQVATFPIYQGIFNRSDKFHSLLALQLNQVRRWGYREHSTLLELSVHNSIGVNCKSLPCVIYLLNQHILIKLLLYPRNF